MKYNLVIPTENTVKRYSSFWEDENNSEWIIPLFRDPNIEVDIRHYTDENPYKKYGVKDEEIRKLKEEDAPKFLKAINSVYRTRVSGLDNVDLSIKDLNNMSFDDFVNYSKKISGKYQYSFATKVYSFLEPEKNPIVDSLSATLLYEYLKAKNEHYNFPKEGWGNYDEYKNAYKEFQKIYSLQKCTYKQIDIFLWTYAIAIQKYWKNIGVLEFSGIQYKIITD